MALTHLACGVNFNKPCIVRVTALGPDCKPLIGSDGLPVKSVSGCIGNISTSPNIETNAPLEYKSACGSTCTTLEDCDELKYMDFGTFEIGTFDYSFLSIVTGQPITTLADGTAIGWGRRQGKVCPPGFAMEVFSKVATPSDECGGVVECYEHTLWPRIKNAHFGSTTRDGTTFQIMSFVSGRGHTNSKWGLGPYNQMPGQIPLPADIAEWRNLWVDAAGVCLPVPTPDCVQRA
jgi:hypothetical protein